MSEMRMTAVVLAALDVLASVPGGCPVWGLAICQLTGYKSGSVYPALARLLDAGLVTSWWEEPPPADSPARRFYALTADGRARYDEMQRRRTELIATARRMGAPAVVPSSFLPQQQTAGVPAPASTAAAATAIQVRFRQAG